MNRNFNSDLYPRPPPSYNEHHNSSSLPTNDPPAYEAIVIDQNLNTKLAVDTSQIFMTNINNNNEVESEIGEIQETIQVYDDEMVEQNETESNNNNNDNNTPPQTNSDQQILVADFSFQSSNINTNQNDDDSSNNQSTDTINNLPNNSFLSNLFSRIIKIKN
jgi:hypothetical protein